MFVRCAWCSGQVSVVTMFEEQAAAEWNRRRDPVSSPPTLGELLDGYFDGGLLREIHKAFGYTEQWRVFPLDDHRDDYWMRLPNSFAYSDVPFTEQGVVSGETVCSAEIYTQRHLTQWVYEADGHVMALLDTRTDGNILLMVFRAERECTDPALKTLYRECWA